MHYLLASVGSLGDCLPYLRIAQALAARGHAVSMFTNVEHEERVRACGVSFVSAGPTLRYEQGINDARLWHPVKGLGVLWRNLLAPSIEPLYQHIASHPYRKQLHVLAGPHMMGARLAQAQLGTRLTSLYTSPGMLRTCIAPTTIAHLSLPRGTPRWLISALWRLVDRYKLDPMARRTLGEICTRLGVTAPPAHESLFGQWMHSSARGITLYPSGFAPVPADAPPQIKSGQFPLSANSSTALDSVLQEFLGRGTPPVVVMLGSAMQHAAPLYARWQEALVASGQRGILVSADAAQLPSPQTNMLHLAFAPFDALLPRCAALVHHGGIGSYAQAMAAGIPQIIQPHGHDQFENARCAAALGSTLKLHRDASSSQMTQALHQLVQDSYRHQAQQLAQRLPGDALTLLCEQIEQVAA
jgi:rhamnosyltransferase subunit B